MEILFACLPLLLGTNFPLLWSALFSPYASALILLSLSLYGATLAHLYFFRSHYMMIRNDGSVPFPFGKNGFGALANYSLCGIEATFFFAVSPVFSSFSAKACDILQAFCWSRQHQQVCHFSSVLGLSLCGCHSVLSYVFPFTSNSLADLAEMVFSLLLFYQATMGPRTFIFPGGQRS